MEEYEKIKEYIIKMDPQDIWDFIIFDLMQNIETAGKVVAGVNDAIECYNNAKKIDINKIF